MNRRNFLKTSSCAGMGLLPFFSSWHSLSKLNAAASSNAYTDGDQDYRALVCILLAGGNDSFNMLVPRGNAEYAAYANSRSNLALPQVGLLPLNQTLQTGLDLGLHPAMPEIQSLYDTGQAAFLSNVGTLIEPTTAEQIANFEVRVPVGLFSHSDQIMQWQTSVPQSRAAIGWGGKMADLLAAGNENENISMNISLAGNNVFQAGNETIAYSVSGPQGGAETLFGFGDPSPFEQIRTAAINNLLEQEYQNLFEQSYVNTINVGQQANSQYAEALQNLPPLTTSFTPGNRLSVDLSLIARTIAAREELQFRRQVFFVVVGGWDHHDEVINIQNQMLGEVSQAIGEFQNAMNELGTTDCVTTFTISDFARTLTSNGNGSDHGWGGNAMIVGGAVNGGEVYGLYPDLGLQSSLDVGDGILIPTTSTDEYFAELALWMGVSPSDLGLVLPNLSNFYSASSNQPPIGFLLDD
ncbi:MAG: DUF1501 domain-containing protein [Bacteroidota bacterium]